MKICALSSGSKGNATIVESEGKALLVDDGITMKLLRERLGARDMSLNDIDAILITHEHSDHIKGVATLAHHLNIPVYAPEACIDTIISKSQGKAIDIRPISETGNEICGLDVESFRVPHDAIYTVGYTIADGRERVGISTDLGEVTPSALRHLSTCNVVMLESNHDRDMLLGGSYPYPLKMRIDSTNGHLSNDSSATAIASLYEKGVTRFVLAHLSEDNNTPEIAFDRVCREFERERLVMGYDYTLDIASAYSATKIINCK